MGVSGSGIKRKRKTNEGRKKERHRARERGHARKSEITGATSRTEDVESRSGNLNTPRGKKTNKERAGVVTDKEKKK